MFIKSNFWICFYTSISIIFTQCTQCPCLLKPRKTVSVPFLFRITASFSTIKQQCSKPSVLVHLFARGHPTSRGWTEENISTSKKAPSHTHL